VAVATALRRRLRDTDAIARLGGDEFAVLLTSADRESASLVAGQLRHAIMTETAKHARPGGPAHLTASIGVAAIETDDANAQKILAAADQAMYIDKAKRPRPVARP